MSSLRNSTHALSSGDVEPVHLDGCHGSPDVIIVMHQSPEPCISAQRPHLSGYRSSLLRAPVRVEMEGSNSNFERDQLSLERVDTAQRHKIYSVMVSISCRHASREPIHFTFPADHRSGQSYSVRWYSGECIWSRVWRQYNAADLESNAVRKWSRSGTRFPLSMD